MTQVWAMGSNQGDEQKDDGFFLLLYCVTFFFS